MEVSIPIREIVDHLSHGVEICEGSGVLCLMRWEEVGSVFSYRLYQLEEMCSYAVVGIVGCGAVAEGEGSPEGALVAGEDG